MNLVQAVNGVLSKLDVAITRRSTLDRTRRELANALAAQHVGTPLAEAPVTTVARDAELASILQKLDSARQQALEVRTELLRHQIAAQWAVIDASDRTCANPAIVRTCPLCGHQCASSQYRRYESNCIFGGGSLVRHQCPSCDVVFGPDKMFRLSAQELTQEYEWHYKVYEEGDSTDLELRAFHSLQPRRDGVYLNYGAGGWSRSVQQLRNEGWNVFAYEPHGSAAAPSQWMISNRAQLDGHRFDGLFSNNVLEHFRDPVEALREMLRWLRPGATMAHATPCYDYLYEYTRFHLFFFPGRARELLAQRAGLSILDFEVDGHFMNCIFSASPLAGNVSERTA